MNRTTSCSFGFAAKVLVVAVLIQVLSIGQPAFAQGASENPTRAQEIIAAFAATVQEGVEADGGGCVMVAVFNGNDVVWSNEFGLADVENNIPATAETIGRTGSISKSFTSVLICQLADQGVLRLDGPVQEHLPELAQLAGLPADAEPITYRMLASHTAGLIREPSSRQSMASGPIHLWEEKVLESIPKTSFKTKPLTEYSYSNIGFGILGLAGSRAADKPVMALVEEQIFRPLEMESSTFIVEAEEMKRRLAVGYLRDRTTGKLDATIPTREHLGRGYKVPNGGIYSTVGDLARFAAALMGESESELLSAEMREQVFSAQHPATGYGLGFSIMQQSDKAHVVGHGGSVAGYRADLWFDLKSKWGVAMLRTTQYSPPVTGVLRDLMNADE